MTRSVAIDLCDPMVADGPPQVPAASDSDGSALKVICGIGAF